MPKQHSFQLLFELLASFSKKIIKSIVSGKEKWKREIKCEFRIPPIEDTEV